MAVRHPRASPTGFAVYARDSADVWRMPESSLQRVPQPGASPILYPGFFPVIGVCSR